MIFSYFATAHRGVVIKPTRNLHKTVTLLLYFYDILDLSEAVSVIPCLTRDPVLKKLDPDFRRDDAKPARYV